MTEPANPPPTIVPPNQGRVVRAFGDQATFHLEGKHTGGRLTMWTTVTPPGGGPPPHYHKLEDELFLVLEGRVSFFHDDQWEEVPVGTIAFMPKGTIHTFKNVGDKPLRMLVQTAPSGFEDFFTKCEQEFARTDRSDMARIFQIAAEFGIVLLPAKHRA